MVVHVYLTKYLINKPEHCNAMFFSCLSTNLSKVYQDVYSLCHSDFASSYKAV